MSAVRDQEHMDTNSPSAQMTEAEFCLCASLGEGGRGEPRRGAVRRGGSSLSGSLGSRGKWLTSVSVKTPVAASDRNSRQTK